MTTTLRFAEASVTTRTSHPQTPPEIELALTTTQNGVPINVTIEFDISGLNVFMQTMVDAVLMLNDELTKWSADRLAAGEAVLGEWSPE